MSISADYVDIGTFIDQREGYRGGRPFIVGTGVTVDRISVLHRIDGMGADEIATEMNLTPSQVMAALRNTAIGLLRWSGESNIAAACRRCAAQPWAALALLGIQVTP